MNKLRSSRRSWLIAFGVFGLGALLSGAGYAGLRRADRPLLAFAADLMVPPLALLLLLSVLLAGVNLGGWILLGFVAPLATSLLALALIASACAVAWRRFGAGTVSGGELLLAPLYALRKLPLYTSFVWRRQTQWLRAKRDGE